MDKGDIVIDGCKNGITFEGIGEDATANGWGLRVKDLQMLKSGTLHT